MASIPLLLMGCGGVGRQLLHHVISCRPLHSQQGVRLRVVGVCDSKSMVAIPDVLTSEFRDDFLLQLCEIKSNGSSFLDLTKTGLALIDCSASSETIGLLSQVINLDGCVVLANKKPLTSPLEYYDKLVSQPRRLRHESTVGAGLPVIATINRMLSSGDPISRIIGSLSGTLGYVMSEVEGGRPFSEVVTSAKKLGFTEPDPRDDLGGMDVARKALILARLLGHRIELDSIKVESLYPEKMGPANIPLDEFLANGLPLLDEAIQKRIESAASNGNVLRYVCLIEESRCEVGLQEVSKDSALGRLQGSDNVVEIYSRCYSKQPLVIQGAGAGNDTTAVGVLADILDIQDMFLHSPSAA
ncbi:bifunctional aspartokinase/homoserine dehydrogenase 1-like isoform X2 [Salvia splendens]|uniref:bifunctional aspartokinase/homoserine dehydrogenase 1-like isoform X2 n=1 Tax=Salvia splendens TaxID=180675 RepID=UPI001C2745DB|nr:bifunctional aspartokinase/homoserine dehydrogenase 1-like isoform X2 [Salvia splendens]